MARYIRGKSAGRFKKEKLKDQSEVAAYARKYFKDHSKSIKNAINNAINRGLLVPRAADNYERTFVSYISASPSFPSKTKATKEMKNTIKTWNGVDLEFEEAKHKGKNRDIFGLKDLRKLNKAKYSQNFIKPFEKYYNDDPNNALEWYVDEYYDINKRTATGDRIIIAKKYEYRYDSNGNPYSTPDEVWEYMKASEIGL